MIEDYWRFMSDSSYRTRLTLIERVRQVELDDDCWEDFVSSYRAYIFVIIRRFNIKETLCEDLLQEVLLQLWKSLPKFEYRPKECRFRTWLSLVTCSVVKNHFKSKAARNKQQEIEYEEALHALDKISEPEVEAIAESEWKIFIAEKALENIRPQLPEKQKVVFEASLRGQSDADVARQLDTTEASVRVYRQRARNALMKEILRLNKELDS